jgi:molecular chaperone GrpE
MIYDKFIGVLKDQGIEKIEALDHEFNPQLHEAMLMQPVENFDKNGKVIAVFQEGYVLNNRLLRPSKVVVGEYAEPKNKN